MNDGDLEKLKKAIISGTLEVEYDNKRVRYRSLDEMMRILNFCKNEIDKNKESSKNRTFNVHTDKNV